MCKCFRKIVARQLTALLVVLNIIPIYKQLCLASNMDNRISVSMSILNTIVQMVYDNYPSLLDIPFHSVRWN